MNNKKGMIMKKFKVLLGIAFLLGIMSFRLYNFNAFPIPPKPSGVEIRKDTSKTVYTAINNYCKALWTGFKLGGEHTGEVLMKKGILEFKDTVLVGGEFEMDMTSITNTDIKDPAMAPKLINHLKSEDFFDVKTYPTASFKIVKVIPYGKVADKQYKYKLVGPLIIKGTSRTMKFEIDIFSHDWKSLSATGRLQIDRSDFNIKYGSGSFFDNLGDKIIYDRINLDISLSLAK